MTRLYLVHSIDGFELCHPEDPLDYERITLALQDTRKRFNLRTMPVKLVRQNMGQSLSTSDSPWFGSYLLVFREQAALALEPILRTSGDLVPAECTETTLFFFIPDVAIDAFDEQNSKVVRFKDGRIMMIENYAFIEE